MRHRLQVTDDGSHTVLDKVLDVTFHSRHGAIQESKHVFIDGGLKPLLNARGDITILETGFGTGLNALLSLQLANSNDRKIHYVAYDLFPISKEIYSGLNYTTLLDVPKPTLKALHEAPWGKTTEISAFFTISKVMADFNDIAFENTFNLIYLDAFAPGAQPEFWESDFIARLARSLHSGGIIVTYCAKGSFKRALRSAGFVVESLPGPPGKREMTRAILSPKQ